MTWVDLLYAKRVTKRILKSKESIEVFKKVRKRLDARIKRDKKILKDALQYLSPIENIKYGYSSGYIDKADYQILLHDAQKKDEAAQKS